MALFSLGIGPVCWLLAAEVFPSHIRAKGMSLAVLVNRVTSAAICLTFLPLSDALGGQSGYFCFFGAVTIGTGVLFLRFVPETKGLTLEELHQHSEERPPVPVGKQRRPVAAAALLAGCLVGCWSSSLSFVPGAENMPQGTPRLYGYDHSHYTVRCRMAFGLKKVPYRMVWVAEDDAETPTKLVGKKVTPICEFPGEAPMPESLDIIAKLENSYGSPLLLPRTDRSDVDAWIKTLSGPMRNLGRPRYIRSSMLPEFHSKSARDRFVVTHPLPDPVTGTTLAKPEWAALPKAQRDETYEHYWKRSPELLDKLNAALKGVGGLIASDKHVSPHGLSYDDIFFYSRLRGLTLIKGVQLPAPLEGYLETMASQSDVPLLNQMAI